MRRTKPNLENLELADLLKIAALATLLFACFPADFAAQQKGQKTFSSPEEATKALVAAAQSNPETHKGRWGDGLTANDMEKCVWIRPELVAQIEFLEWTEGDPFRNEVTPFTCSLSRDVVRPS